jgi:myo-inositol-1(or 4)-monophosphatase
MMDRASDLKRIDAALAAGAKAVQPFTPGAVAYEVKSQRDDPLTQADLAVDRVLREILPSAGEGWLSEETSDDPGRLEHRRCWIVDPIDGTREFVEGIPEWCISIGLVEDGRPVAGGILNPATGLRVIGSVETGVRVNDVPLEPASRTHLSGSRVYASRSEVRRGEWQRFSDAPFQVVPCGSVAYKLALVAAGLADATWTLVPKHEWDVAAGAALVQAAGMTVILADGTIPQFNRPSPKLPNFLAGPDELLSEFRSRWL